MGFRKLGFCGFLCLTLAACADNSFNGNNGNSASGGSNAASADDSMSGRFGTDANGEPKLGTYSLTDKAELSKGLDLVIALDTSGSMTEESAAIASNLSQMLLSLQKGSLDPRIHLIMSNERGPAKGKNNAPATAAFTFPQDLDPTKVAHVDQPVDSHDSLVQVTGVLSGAYAAKYKDIKGQPLNPPMPLRAGAKLEVLVISDDNATFPNAPAGAAAAFDKEGKYKATVSGIIGLPNSQQVDNLCKIAAIGKEYIDLATRSGGSMLDICSKDWAALTQRLSTDIVKRSISVLLSRKPLDPTKLVVSLNAKPIDAGGWTYAPEENRVYLPESTAYDPGMVLAVNYEAID